MCSKLLEEIKGKAKVVVNGKEEKTNINEIPKKEFEKAIKENLKNKKNKK